MRNLLLLLLMTSGVYAHAVTSLCGRIITGNQHAYRQLFQVENDRLFEPEGYYSAFFNEWNRILADHAGDHQEEAVRKIRSPESAYLFTAIDKETLNLYRRMARQISVDLSVFDEGEARFTVERNGRARIEISDETQEFELYFVLARAKYWYSILQRLETNPQLPRLRLEDAVEPLNARYEALLYLASPGGIAAATALALSKMPPRLALEKRSLEKITFTASMPWILSINTAIRQRGFLRELNEDVDLGELSKVVETQIERLDDRIRSSFEGLVGQIDFVFDLTHENSSEQTPNLQRRLRRGKIASRDLFFKRLERTGLGLRTEYEAWKNYWSP